MTWPVFENNNRDAGWVTLLPTNAVNHNSSAGRVQALQTEDHLINGLCFDGSWLFLSLPLSLQI